MDLVILVEVRVFPISRSFCKDLFRFDYLLTLQVGEERVYSNKMIDLLLEYGPSWKSDLLQDIHMRQSH